MKTREIFAHPWVVNFEKELKKAKIEQITKEEGDKKRKDLKNLYSKVTFGNVHTSEKKVDFTEKLKLFNEKALSKLDLNKVEKEDIKEEIKQRDKLSDEKGSSTEKLLKVETVNSSLLQGRPVKIKEDLANFSILSSSNQDNLFDKVLDQIQSKNKGKEGFIFR